jgi:hypothetical protein
LQAHCPELCKLELFPQDEQKAEELQDVHKA